MQEYGRTLRDPDLQHAVSMNGHEESRHAAMLAGLTKRYGIPVGRFETEATPDPEWGFLKVGYGECFDSFFGFGLFALALWLQTVSRLKTALRVKNANPQDNFTMRAHESFGDFSARQFVGTCLKENARRPSAYDKRPLRPEFMPRLAKAALACLPPKDNQIYAI